MSPVVDVVRTYLELRSPQQLRPSSTDASVAQFFRRDRISVDDYRRLYRAVGEPWYWYDRNAWSDEKLTAYLASSTVIVWECVAASGDTAGYFELEHHDDGSVEIVYFGLVDAFMGRGLGKAMLTRAAEEAWALGVSRVWLHTCTLDSPRALPNYKSRGFEPYRTEKFVVQLPGTTTTTTTAKR